MALDIISLEDGFDLIKDDGFEMVGRFYERLHAMEPKLARRFARTDMEAQKRRVVEVLLLLRRSFRDLSKITPALESLGRRHAELRIPPHEFLAVGYALIEAMGDAGGSGWIERYGPAWTDAYRLVMDLMLESGRAEAQLRAENERRLSEEIDRLRQDSRLAKFKDALRYGQHLRGCPARRSWLPKGPCECGWDAVHAELQG